MTACRRAGCPSTTAASSRSPRSPTARPCVAGANGLALSDAELTELASRFHAGDQLWRVPITHFTPWDHNWPYGPPPDAQPPQLKEFEWKDPNDPCNRKGSTIACEAQTVGEDIPLTGTSVHLNYTSGRQPGYKADASFDIPVTPVDAAVAAEGRLADGRRRGPPLREEVV